MQKIKTLRKRELGSHMVYIMVSGLEASKNKPYLLGASLRYGNYHVAVP